ncbi:MAG: ATP-binding protein [Anaerolineaceae bacterium]|nr:ATP-binding protein [Anaerolineaceae bacterium]
MAETLMDRLEMARRQQFVGRQNERELFQAAVTAVEMPFFVLYLFGPGGVGKSSLLREFGHAAAQAKADVIPLDGRSIDANPDAFLAAIQSHIGAPDPQKVFSTLRERDGRTVILIDTAEMLFPLDGWLQDSFLPHLPHTVFVVIAGRNPPSLRWRTDPGWQQLMHVLPIKNLSQEESRAFLMRRQIPARQHEAVLNFTHGHPLALSLVADVFAQQPMLEFRPENAPNIIKTLMEQFMQEAPSAQHRAALEACSQVRLLNEPLLAAMLQVADPHPIFEWLRDLSFMDSERRGIYPHDLAREALAADLRWRNPARQAELHTLARRFYIEGFHERDARQQRQILSDYIFLHRDNSIIRAYFDWQSTGTVFTDNYQEADREAVLAMIGQHEGETAVQLAIHWLNRQSPRMVVLRQAGGSPEGLLLLLPLEKCSAADRKLDPAVAAAWNYLETHAPLRAGETATLFRFWMAADTYQGLSPIQSRIFLNMVQHYLTMPGLAFTMIPCAEPDFWTAVFGFADLHRLPEADFTVAGRTFGVYGHDWRVVPPLIWLANMADQELGFKGEAAVPNTLPTPLPILDEAAFATAVHDALREFTNEVALQNNPLLESRCLLNKAGASASKTARVELLRSLLTEAAQTMQNHPRQIKWYRALHHTYFQPAATQEQAAELLDLPFSTYRRYLRTAVQYVIDWLWAQEVGQ